MSGGCSAKYMSGDFNTSFIAALNLMTIVTKLNCLLNTMHIHVILNIQRHHFGLHALFKVTNVSIHFSSFSKCWIITMKILSFNTIDLQLPKLAYPFLPNPFLRKVVFFLFKVLCVTLQWNSFCKIPKAFTK